MAETKTSQVFGIIGGSGVYDIEGLTNKEWRKVESPFGQPSDALLFGELNGQQMVFLPRHGRGHKIPPSEINFKANIDALKRSGVTDVVPGHICLSRPIYRPHLRQREKLFWNRVGCACFDGTPRLRKTRQTPFASR